MRINRIYEIQNQVSKMIHELSFIVDTAIEYNESDTTVQCKAADHLIKMFNSINLKLN